MDKSIEPAQATHCPTPSETVAPNYSNSAAGLLGFHPVWGSQLHVPACDADLDIPSALTGRVWQNDPIGHHHSGAVLLEARTVTRLIRCPDAEFDELGNPHTVIGCGAMVPDLRDDDGIVDCPVCGIWFSSPRNVDRSMGGVARHR